MPCSDGGQREYDARISVELQATSEKLVRVEAMLCAVLAHLEDTFVGDVFKETMKTCETDGSIPGILEWWAGHKEEDNHRIAKALTQFYSNFSEQEQKIINTLVKDRS